MQESLSHAAVSDEEGSKLWFLKRHDIGGG